VKLTYKGKKSYKTNIGAGMSIIAKAVMVAFIAFELYVIISRKHPKVAIKHIMNDFAVDPTASKFREWNPIELGFDIAIGVLAQMPDIVLESSLQDNWSPISLNPTYGYLIAELVS
jgi:hypothetical protein